MIHWGLFVDASRTNPLVSDDVQLLGQGRSDLNALAMIPVIALVATDHETVSIWLFAYTGHFLFIL